MNHLRIQSFLWQKMVLKPQRPWVQIHHLLRFPGNREPLFNYFKQRFAQVTNPPIDSIREEVVTSTTLYIGDAGNVLEEKAKNCHVLKVNNPDPYKH